MKVHMNLKSIRWKLPLTYAGIALITALVLGGTLLLIVRRYYQDQELNYLHKNAVAISSAVEPFFTTDQKATVPDDLKSHLSLLAFLSQTKIRLFNPQGNEIYSFSFIGEQNPKAILSAISLPNPPDTSSATLTSQADILKASGELTGPVTISGNSNGSGMIGIQVFNANPAPSTGTGSVSANSVASTGPCSNSTGPGTINANPVPSTGLVTTSANPAPGTVSSADSALKIISIPSDVSADVKTTSKVILSQIPVVNTMYGVDLQGGASAPAPRSDQVYCQAITSSTGALLGSVELSDGPAYGMDIVTNVAFGWIISSLVGVLIAVLAGWWISRRINAPILVLTDSTRRMASGDLSARAAIRDRDEFGALASAFNTMAGQVEETVAALRRFVADAAHELQTPLTALRTNLELASGENKLSDQVTYLENAQQQVERLNHLVRDLLDLSRLETGLPNGHSGPLDLADFARRASEPYAAQAEQCGIELSLQLPAEPVTVTANETQLQHALGNLLDNALKFTPPDGTTTLSIAVEGEWACLRVADTGIGIPPDDLPGLFERFHRGRNAASYPGSGLGLAIVKAIAQSNGGRVSAENTSSGACFTLYLPHKP
jgi:signal transduction histidine kinase